MSIPSGRQLLIIGRFAEYLLASGALVVQTCRNGVTSWILKLWLLKVFGTYKFTGKAWTFLHHWFKCSTRPYSTWALEASVKRCFKSLRCLVRRAVRFLPARFPSRFTTSLPNSLFFRYVTDFSPFSAEQNRYHGFKSLCVSIFVLAGCCGK